VFVKKGPVTDLQSLLVTVIRGGGKNEKTSILRVGKENYHFSNQKRRGEEGEGKTISKG